jgi:hypothetical protein
MEYYALQPGFCQAWLDEAADETVAATVNLAPPWTRSHYRGSAPSIRKELREILQALIEAQLNCMNDIRKQKSGTPARLAAVSLQQIAVGATALPAEVRTAAEAADMFVSLPSFPSIELWKQDRLNKLAAAATKECSHVGSKACARVALSRYNIKAAAFKRLVSTIELQNAFMMLLDYWEHVAWTEFTGIGTPKEIRSGAPSIAPGLARRKRWWIRQGYKQLERRQAEQGQKELTNLRPRRCDPLLWRNFSYEKTSKTSKFRELLIYNFVSLSVPAHQTHRDVVEQIARESHIPVESLSDDLNQPVFSRGQAIFGFAGDQFDQIADDYDNMQWWISDIGLNMAIVVPATSDTRIPTLDDLMLDIHGSPGSGGPESDSARVPLPALLREAEGRTADPKLRNKLAAVLRYNRYFEDLKMLKTACKRYQTPALLEQQFPDLDVWAALEDADKADIAKGNFQPGIFAWALVKRIIGLRGHHNRTLKNYRNALRAAGLL